MIARPLASRSLGALLGVVAAALGGAIALPACYSPSYAPCSVRCGPTGNYTCPSGLECTGGFCQDPDEPATCGGSSDAAVLADAASVVDGGDAAPDADAPPPLPFGAACEAAGVPCEAPATCQDLAGGDGLGVCTVDCGVGCPAGSWCVTHSPTGQGLCLGQCGDDASIPPGGACPDPSLTCGDLNGNGWADGCYR